MSKSSIGAPTSVHYDRRLHSRVSCSPRIALRSPDGFKAARRILMDRFSRLNVHPFIHQSPTPWATCSVSYAPTPHPQLPDHFLSPSLPDPKIAFLIPQANPPSERTCCPASLKSCAMARLIAVSLSACVASSSCCSCCAGVTSFAKIGSVPSRRACSFTSSGWNVEYTIRRGNGLGWGFLWQEWRVCWV